MEKKIASALISVFDKTGIVELAKTLIKNKVTIYSTGGTQKYLEENNIPCISVEAVTSYPSIFGGRVKTLHPKIFGGILAQRNKEADIKELSEYEIPEIDLVIVDLYPFEKTLQEEQEIAKKNNSVLNETAIIEKIDIGGPSMIRAAAKNFSSVVSIASKEDYLLLNEILTTQKGSTTLEQRKDFAAKAFNIVMHYDIAINNFFNASNAYPVLNNNQSNILRYGENPHQQSIYYGNLKTLFNQLNGKELSYNNLVDVEAAIELYVDIQNYINENILVTNDKSFFAIIKHTNVCGIAVRDNLINAWDAALGSDNESAFGGILICNQEVVEETAQKINELFFEVLIAPSFSVAALLILQSKKNRILLQLHNSELSNYQYKSLLGGVLQQQNDNKNIQEWNEVGDRKTTEFEKQNLVFANIICKHLKSNAIAIVKNMQLIGKGCGQTSRIDALKQAITKANQFNFDLKNSVLASDAFFPFSDCVELAFQSGINAFIQPGGSIRDKDSIEFCQKNNIAMVLTGIRHFKH